jgi:hypothetical protein
MNLFIVSLVVCVLMILLMRLRSVVRVCIPSAPILVGSTSDYIESRRAEWLRDDLALFGNVHNWRTISRYVTCDRVASLIFLTKFKRDGGAVYS